MRRSDPAPDGKPGRQPDIRVHHRRLPRGRLSVWRISRRDPYNALSVSYGPLLGFIRA